MLSLPLLRSANEELRWYHSLPLHACFPALRVSGGGCLTKLHARTDHSFLEAFVVCVVRKKGARSVQNPLLARSFTSILSKLHRRKAISLLAVDEVRHSPREHFSKPCNRQKLVTLL